jgi:hypothetical protein
LNFRIDIDGISTNYQQVAVFKRRLAEVSDSAPRDGKDNFSLLMKHLSVGKAKDFS